jgi:hypothetical protein
MRTLRDLVDEQPLDVAKGLEGMAEAMSHPACRENPWPNPMNVVPVLRYAAKIIRNANAPRERAGAATATLRADVGALRKGV